MTKLLYYDFNSFLQLSKIDIEYNLLDMNDLSYQK
jgi:hypothetical protein